MTLTNTLPDTSDLNVISLHFAGNAVMAKYIGPHSEEIKSLFQSDTILTAFTSYTPMDSIIAEISRLNPDVLVCWQFDGVSTVAIIEVK
jgi:hypothetical protein